MDQEFNIKPELLNLIEEKVEKSLECIGTGANFLSRALIMPALRSTINETESLLQGKEYHQKEKWHLIEWKNISYQHHIQQSSDIQNI